jgi:phospholipid-binding lipoprotein MlaA
MNDSARSPSIASPAASAKRSSRLRAAVAACAVAVILPQAAFAQVADPWMSVNRPIFAFNDALDRYALEPVAKGYKFALPDFARTGVTNFFANIWFPVVFTNCVLQGKPLEATHSFTRFFINTTIGVGGLFDVATHVDVLSPNEDFGQTLGYWGVHTGPYLVLPLFGPSNVRDTVGRVADSATRVWPYFVPWWVSSGSGVVEIVNTRARYLEEVNDLRESSVDYYAAVRDAYMQRREALVEDRVGNNEEKKHLPSEDDLYFPDEAENPAQ